ncbi:hypothetical protein OM076_35120 [Solirubrobacter ginsenosidimutans]|uniref:Uncharacterized protein n=1 Tax=Solirubrobacter ginsenosidimutans TaxID=490573 RepID=A0A9X3S495_9ACTN|nr:hypothetical protein [Solirubrobacter ginsenosidimutans]MDA0165554.1 hypothetical protein [Solirubrobacter ginsenosidimutans]
MTWPLFLRDADGTIVLEEVDEDTGTAVFRVYGRRTVVATATDSGIVVEGEAPAVLRAAFAPREFGRFVAASRWS